MSEYEAIAEEDEPVVVEHVTVVEEPGAAGEMLRFFALVTILGVVVLVVAVARPLIFGRIVPAVMGEGIVLPTAEPPASDGDGEEETSTPAESPNEAESTSEEAPSEENTASEIESSETNEAGTTDESEAEAQEGTTNESSAGETAENQTPSLTHTVIQGETLQKIAAQYGVPLQELIAANHLTNPDYIRVGDKLVIPQAESGE